MMRVVSPVAAALRSRRGVVIVEFAIVAPVLMTLLMLVADFGIALNMRLRVGAAAGAAAQYIHTNGTGLTQAGFAAFANSVKSVVTSTADLSVTPVVTVLINNTSDGSGANSYYCVSGSPPVWTAAASSSSTCSSNLTAGQFITLSISASIPSLFPTDPVIGAVFPLSETIIVRVK